MTRSAPLLALAALWLSAPAVADHVRDARHATVDAMAAAAPVSGGRACPLIAPDIDPKKLWDGRKVYEEFRACDSPKMIPAARAKFLEDPEYVLGVTVKGQSRAYPTRFVAWHHIVNDRVTDPATKEVSHFTVTLCIVCNTAMRFDPVVNGRPLKLDFYGLYNGVLAMYDRGSDSVFLQVGGRAVKGPLTGTVLKRGPLLYTTWKAWKKLHPDTTVMAPDSRFAEYYEERGTVMPRGYSSFPAPYFSRTMTRKDLRLPAFSLVLALALPEDEPADEDAAPVTKAAPEASAVPEAGAAVKTAAFTDAKPAMIYRAYPMTALQHAHGAINDTVGSHPVAALLDIETETAIAVSRVLDGRVLTFEARKVGTRHAIFDIETGTRWNIEGVGEAGPLAGRSLDRLNSCTSQWYGWSAYFPQTTIYKTPDQKPITRHSNPSGLAPLQLPGQALSAQGNPGRER